MTTDWMSMSLQNSRWNLAPQCAGIRSWGLGRWPKDEGTDIMKGTSGLRRRDMREFLIPPLCLPATMLVDSQKMTMCKPGMGPLPDTRPASAIILYLPGSRIVKNKRLMFKPLSLWYFAIAAPADSDMYVKTFQKAVANGYFWGGSSIFYRLPTLFHCLTLLHNMHVLLCSLLATFLRITQRQVTTSGYVGQRGFQRGIRFMRWLKTMIQVGFLILSVSEKQE